MGTFAVSKSGLCSATIALNDACGDQPAVGHTDGSVADNYRHGIADDRLIKVSQFVRNWLFGAAKQGN